MFGLTLFSVFKRIAYNWGTTAMQPKKMAVYKQIGLQDMDYEP